ncbi:hypothetical protein LTR05_004368 [Lithohypha guttulata]|uniref:Uncharacterized protein n=1 Tax=Lithohypha guttulata TaxID=1690604 RepID=A0AAN7T2Q2_9EURO|nr:hypothetical protein LTR05_004368 [Lithohypha guttulata]
MPFDFVKYDAKCAAMSAEELQREWEHYTRLISGSATSTAVSGLAMPFTLGVSSIGVGLASMSIHNARKKREIIDRHLGQRGALHNTRKRDVFAPICVSGTVGIVTLGVGAFAADAITTQATEHAFTTIAENELAVKVTTHLALDAAVMAGEEEHMKNKKTQEAAKTARKVPSQVKETATQYAPSAVELQPPEKPPRPSSYTPSSYVDGSMDDDLQSQFKGLNVSAPEAEIPRGVTPAPPYAPNPVFFANDMGKPTDTTTIYLPPLPPRANKMCQPSEHGDTRPAPAEPHASYFPPAPPIGNYPSATFVTANAVYPAGTQLARMLAIFRPHIQNSSTVQYLLYM